MATIFPLTGSRMINPCGNRNDAAAWSPPERDSTHLVQQAGMQAGQKAAQTVLVAVLGKRPVGQ